MQDREKSTASENEEFQEELLQDAMSANRTVAIETLFAHAAHDMHHRLDRCLGISSDLMHDPKIRQDKRLYSKLKGLQDEIKYTFHYLRSTMELYRGRGEKTQPLSVNQEIPKIVEIWRNVLHGKRCTVQLNLNAKGDSILMPRNEFQELLSVLLVNAVEAHARHIALKTESSGDTDIRGGAIGNAIRLVVEDDGHGISQRDLEQLFSPSFTTKTDQPGFGLFIARSLARKAGGELRCDTASHGRGATFTAILPVRDR